METTKDPSIPKANTGLIYIGILSFILFICPLLMFVLSRIFSWQSASFGYQDIFMFFSYWLAAVLVWMRFKFMWLVAISLLCIVVLVNAIALFQQSNMDNSPVLITQFMLSIAALSAVLLLADYLNTKAFDRRDQFSILGAATRYAVMDAAEMVSPKGQIIPGKVTSLSFSGALFEADKVPSPFTLNGWKINISGRSLNNQSVEIIEIDNSRMRLKFVDTNPLKLWKLNSQLKVSNKS